MTKNERRLLSILVRLGIITLLTVGVYLYFEHLHELQEAIREYRVRIDRLHTVNIDEAKARRRVEELESQIRILERSRDGQTRPLADFGHAVRAEFEEQGISLSRFQESGDKEKDQIEFVFTCEALAFMRFLRSVKARNGEWSIPYMSIHTRPAPGKIDAVVRISDERF